MRKRFFILVLFLSLIHAGAVAQESGNQSKERKYYSVEDVRIPAEIMLEVGGMDFMENGNLAVCTRMGEVWIIEDPYQSKSKTPKYTRFASGLHEPLGLKYHKGSIYVNQRAELTRLTDTNNDGVADLFETITSWPISGNYHEYNYGPLFLPDGNMLVTLNLSWVGRGESLTKWRGWMVKVTPEGEVIPFAAGMRSPAGFGLNKEGDIFYAENQGDWISSGRITHIEHGDFAGHPASLKWSKEKNSPLAELSRDQFPDSIGSMVEFGKQHKQVKQPAIIFPHTLMGISTSDIVTIPDGFGPFEGQLLVGDQGHSKVMRAYLEKVNGEYQGACFPFLEGFSSGILRLKWGADQTLFVGMTSRGWAATGKALFGLQRVSWKGNVPFEIKQMNATTYGFDLHFTKPLNKKLPAIQEQFKINGFTYAYHRKYGSPVIDLKSCPVTKVEISDDGLVAKLFVDGLREGYVHQLEVGDVKSVAGEVILHPVAYYTLNSRPNGSADHASHHDHAVTSGDEKGGCGENKTKTITALPAGWSKPDVEIFIGTKPGLKFDKELFEVHEGAKIKLTFNNNDDMLHNLLITKPGKGEAVGKMALELGLRGTELGFIPTSNDLLWSTCLLQPETSQSLYFTAPVAGDYPFICSYPGHFSVMKGIMRVVKRK